MLWNGTCLCEIELFLRSFLSNESAAALFTLIITKSFTYILSDEVSFHSLQLPVYLSKLEIKWWNVSYYLVFCHYKLWGVLFGWDSHFQSFWLVMAHASLFFNLSSIEYPPPLVIHTKSHKYCNCISANVYWVNSFFPLSIVVFRSLHV